MLNLAYFYPPEHVKSAQAAVAQHDFRANFVGFKQDPRRYIPDDERGLLARSPKTCPTRNIVKIRERGPRYPAPPGPKSRSSDISRSCCSIH
jgi:hypothetical protein